MQPFGPEDPKRAWRSGLMFIGFFCLVGATLLGIYGETHTGFIQAGVLALCGFFWLVSARLI